MVVVAPSGTGKSNFFKEVTNPIMQFQAVCRVNKEPQRLLYNAEQMIQDRKIKKAIAAGASVPTTDQIAANNQRVQLASLLAQKEVLSSCQSEPTLVCEDVTSERLAVILSQNEETIFSASPDAGQILSVLLGRYNRVGRVDDALYLKGYSGDYCQVDRVSRKRITLHSPCLTLLWLVQPEKLETMLSEKSLTEGGFLPRTLICNIDARPTLAHTIAPNITPEIKQNWSKLIFDLFSTYNQSDTTFKLVANDDARQALTAHYNRIVKRRLSDLSDADSFAARWNEWAWRLTIVLHAGKYGSESHNHNVDLETVDGAIVLADWFAAQQLEILAHSREKVRVNKEKAIFELIVKKGKITARDVQHARIAYRSVEANLLLESMEHEHKLLSEIIQPKKGGHSVRQYWRA
jgi:hypothetical protein